MPMHLETAENEVVEAWKEWVDLGEEIENHPKRHYRYYNPNLEAMVDVDLIHNWRKIYNDFGVLKKGMQHVWPEHLKSEVGQIKADQYDIQLLKIKRGQKRKVWDAIMYSKSPQSVFSVKRTELISLFGQWKSLEEVKEYIEKEWKQPASMERVKEFFFANQEPIELERTKWENKFGHIAVTKARGRLEQLSYLFATQRKMYEEQRYPVNRSAEMRNILAEIRREVEGDRIVLDINGKIDVDLTVNVNMTFMEISRQIPLLSFIVSMVASKRGVNPVKLMYALQTSIYARYSGVGSTLRGSMDQDLSILPSRQVYDWIQLKDQAYDVEAEEVKPVVLTADEARKAEKNRARLMQLLKEKQTQLDKL